MALNWKIREEWDHEETYEEWIIARIEGLRISLAKPR
jgi:hypothetical protein